jgi:hypothetical protein
MLIVRAHGALNSIHDFGSIGWECDVGMLANARLTVMRHANRLWMSLWGAVALLGGLWCWSPSTRAAEHIADTPPTDIVTSAWQHHKVMFSYVGVTSLYTCDGLEGQVRQILLHLGARKGVTVTATGCPGPFNTPSHSAWVDADFYTLVPSADASGSDTVKARWTSLEVTSQRPSFIGDGDCELIEEMKDLITKNFSLRDVEYRTQCVPHEVTLDAFAVKGQALRAVPPKANAVRG